MSENDKILIINQIRELFNNYELTFFRRQRLSMFISKLSKYKLTAKEQRWIGNIKKRINFIPQSKGRCYD